MADAALVMAPEGVEIDIVIYLTSPTQDLNISVGLRGLPGLTPFKAEFDPVAAATKIAGTLGGLADDWRVMTRAEIAAYKAEEDEEEANG